VENYHFEVCSGALWAGYAAPAPRSPGTCNAGRIGQGKMAQEVTRELAGFPIPVMVRGDTSQSRFP